MSTTVIVPQIGQSIVEATIVRWFKKPGERIEKGESLVEIGTDKINTELPAPASGIVVKLLVQEGETVPINTEIAILSDEDAVLKEAVEIRKPVEAETKAPFIPEISQRTSPLVRRLAQEHKIDLREIKGSGAGGRVTKEDILQAIETLIPGGVPPCPPKDSSTGGTWRAETPTPQSVRVPMSRMRRLISEHMALSRRTAADVTTFFEIDMTEVVRQREKAKTLFQNQHGVKLTYLPFVIIALVKALRAFPILNSSVEGDDIVHKRDINIGIAIAIQDGLVVPVIKHADEENILGLARAAQDLSERARNRRLSPDDLQGGTFTITNPGVYGALMGTPIIHQPQVAILGTGAVVKRPVVINDAVAIRSMAYFSLSYDHRALDGATADQFLAHIKHTLESQSPSALD